MTSVGPDLLLPGVASKKPTPATKADGRDSPETSADDRKFAQELDAVNTPPADKTSHNGASDKNDNAPTVTEATSQTEVAAPAAPTDDADEIAASPIGADPPAVVTNEVAPAPDTSLVAIIQSPTATISVDGEDASTDIALASSEPDRTAEVIPDGSLLPPIVAPAPDALAGRETVVADSSQLLSPVVALNGSGAPSSLGQAPGQTPLLTPATTSNTPQPQGPNPSLMAANLALDPHGLGTTDADGDPSTNMQSSNKSALRAAASLKTDAKPLETTGGQTFSSTLGAAASEAANQTARSAAQAAAHRPARPAQTAPATAQVAVHIVRAVADGVSRFNVQLQPAELGRVEVKMEISRDGAVRAMVVADRQETVDQLQRDSRALERALQEAGLKADSQNLHFSLRGGQNGHAMSENRTSIGNSGNGEADITEVSESALAVHWSNVAGSTGALDIRV